MAEVSDHQSNNQVRTHATSTRRRGNHTLTHRNSLQRPQIEADGAAAILSMLLLLIGIVSIITLSVTSRTPFSAHGTTLAFTLWCFLAALILLVLSFAASTNGLENDHTARVLALFSGLSQTLGLRSV